MNSRKVNLALALLMLLSCNLDSGYPFQLPQKSSVRPPLIDPGDKRWNEAGPESFRVRFETTKGPFVIEAHRNWAPIGVDRLWNLVRAGFFDDSRFYRVRAGYIVQFGIPGKPAIANVWRDLAMPDDPVLQSNKRGFVAYAMTGPNTRTTQIYINLVDNTQLDGQGFSPIGQVVEGMDVVDRLYAGYGEESGGGMRAGKQGKLFEEGNAYMDREYPKLDRLTRATLIQSRPKGSPDPRHRGNRRAL